MNICMLTNTYLPHVGGVARSVSTFAEEFRKRGHNVLVVAPNFPGKKLPRRAEAIVERVAAIQNFNGSDFAVRLPLAAALSDRIDAFRADIIHAHHPFLLGETALRLAANRNVPVVFTHHTRYEDYTHYVGKDSPTLRHAAINLSTEFANLCDGVIAPSESIARLITKRGVEVPVRVVPTGIDVKAFASGDGSAFRRRFAIPARCFVIGHLGRLAPEKNLGYLARAVALFIRQTRDTRFLVIGGGPSEDTLKAVFAKAGIGDRLVLAGKQTGRAVADAYAAMDGFAFASFSETQGMVLAEAMAAGRPVVALAASGVREVVRHGVNGFLLPARTPAAKFSQHLARLHAEPSLLRAMAKEARLTAQTFSKEHCADRAFAFYEDIRLQTRRERLLTAQSPWGILLNRVGVEWDLIAKKTQLIADALLPGSPPA